MATEKRLIDAKLAQHIANVELIPDQAGIVLWVLSKTPTIDAVEVVHGLWDDECRCSACGWYGDDKYKRETINFAYCPNCGAKMDGDGNG